MFRVGKLVAWPVRRRLAEFEAATHRPREVQEALLRDILAYNFPGQIYHFWALGKVFGWGRTVPLYAVKATSSTGAWAGGFGAALVVTADGGANWVPQGTGAAGSFFGIATRVMA